MAEPGGLPSMGSHTVGHDWSDLAAAAAGLITLDEWFSARRHLMGSCVLYIASYQEAYDVLLLTMWTWSLSSSGDYPYLPTAKYIYPSQ